VLQAWFRGYLTRKAINDDHLSRIRYYSPQSDHLIDHICEQQDYPGRRSILSKVETVDQGEGQITFENGSVYKGQWHGVNKDGYGI
jgi:hypothetical protein